MLIKYSRNCPNHISHNALVLLAPVTFEKIPAIVVGLLYHVFSVMAQSLSFCSPYMLCLKVKLPLFIMKHHVIKQYKEVQCRVGSASVFMSPSVKQLYPQAAGSLVVAFYDLQGYGGGLAPCINTLDSSL
jgi:hypothetical protein